MIILRKQATRRTHQVGKSTWFIDNLVLLSKDQFHSEDLQFAGTGSPLTKLLILRRNESKD